MRTVTAGIRYFQCDSCNSTWESESRDCQSPSGELCPNYGCPNMDYGVLVSPYQFQKQPEWPTDDFGNLIDKRIRY
ncbi:hypothetical protein N9948_01825 [bacterium]|nr:hypothetical protein [bacterium]